MNATETDLTALSWCLGEIRESLSRAEACLEQQLQAEDDDVSQLKAARVHLHQAHGALQVVDMPGVAVVTQEAEGILDRVDRGELSLNGDVVSRLAKAFGAIVEYLESVAAGAPDRPVLLFPQYRALLEARSAERIEPADLYFPDLTIRPARLASAEPLDAAGAAAARGEFERGLLGFLRNPRDVASLTSLHASVERLYRAHQASSSRTFWWLAVAFFDALRHQALPVDLYVKRLVARINLQIRRTLQQGTPIADRTLKDLLFMLARAGGGSTRTDEARDLYGLAGTVPADFESARFGVVDVRSLRAAKEATAQAKSAWEKYVRGGAQDLPPFAAAAQSLESAAARLPWPGLQRLAATIAGARRALAATGGSLIEALSLEVATALLFVEQALERGARGIAQYDHRAGEMADRLERICAQQESSDGDMPPWLTELSQAAQEQLTLTAFVAELTANLRACEKALDAFFRDPSQRAELAQLDALLHQAGGALRLLGHHEAAEGAAAVARQIAGFLDDPEAPPQTECERVAHSLGALGFFVESLRQGGRSRAGFGFDAESGEFVARLGEPPPVAAAHEPEPADEVPVLTVPWVDARGGDRDASPRFAPTRPLESFDPNEDLAPFDVTRPIAEGAQPYVAAPAPPVIVVPPTLERSIDENRQRVADLLAALQSRPADPLLRGQLNETLRTLVDEAVVVDDSDLRERARSALALLDQPGDTVAVAALAQALALAGALAPAGVPAADEGAVPEGDALDAELLEIFLAEAREVLAAVAGASGQSVLRPSDSDALTTIRRGFHTLKGSSRMVGLVAFGEAAWSMEQVLNGWLAEERPATPELNRLIDVAHGRFVEWVDRLQADATASIEPAALIVKAERLMAGMPIEGEDLQPALAQDRSVEPSDAGEVVELGEVAELGEMAELGEVAEQPAAHDLVERGATADSGASSDFGEAIMLDDGVGIDEAATLDAGAGGEVIELGAVFQSDDVVETGEVVQAAPEPAPEPTPEPAPEFAPAAAGEFEDAAQDVRIGDRTLSAALYQIFLAEADELMAVLVQLGGSWRRDPAATAPEYALRAVHSLVGSSRVVGLSDVRAIAERLERLMQAHALARRAIGPDDVSAVEHALERVQAMLHQFAAGHEPAPEPQAIARIDELARRWAQLATQAADSASRAPAGEPAVAPVDEIDAELASVFIEEADEHLPRIGDELRQWASRLQDASLPKSLMRLLHTVKGSARMAGAMRLGQMVHEMETRIETASGLPRVPAALLEELIAQHDRVLTLFEAVRHPESAQARAAAQRAFDAASQPPPVLLDAAQDTAKDAAVEGPAAPAPALGEPGPVEAADVAATAGKAGTAPSSAAVQPLIRVRADILDKLVNEAGEVSIARARLENELGGIRQSLGELSENVARLRSQLREIEMAADSQIEARHGQGREAEAHFDPLEFDRYTRFQELSRMLAESVNDVATVQQNALRNLEDASRDLSRQSKVTRDLQQNLMRIRMVQFGSVSDRLFRVVRQAAKELDKRVHLDLKGASAELDRSVLERMAGPIEHLLRNSVAHGIESRADRLAAGKAETGEITLEVRQEGNEVTLAFSDDGAGLNYARIQARALERGLIEPDARPPERELAQLIFMPGFSTAHEVTTLAGRGVGLDVVRAEVAAMGGRIDLDSRPGRGTRITVHLPVSLAVAQVVLLTVGATRVAVASSLVEQVLQLKPEAVAAAYERHEVDWHDQPVPLYFLGSLLELAGCTPLAQRYSPVVILRSGAQRIALHVDHVEPNQEVVVKHVGPQLARLTGMAGATVLGNGDVVLILNPVQIAATRRGQQAGEGDTASFAPTRIEVAPTVMVVDDSVTVRKVTQRLLTREGYQVMLAKDGVDALRQLQDVVPDVMLVDIEMPRMDGFDLTRNLRSDERFRGVPIVMITSRTADKHRNHAMSLGVDVYLGKPYDEEELLRHVRGFLARRTAPMI